MKLGKNEQLGVQVGGGYVTISDFVEKYTHKEVEKIRRGETIDNLNNAPRLRYSPLASPASPRSSNISERSNHRVMSPRPVPNNSRFSSPIKNNGVINYKKSKSPRLLSRRMSIPGALAI